MNPARQITAEAIGTAFLLATVIGSGMMGERLAGGNVALALLANTLATGAALVALILTFGPISGAHFNPAVTIADASQGGMTWRLVPGYIAAQVAGAFAGVAAAHLMFGEPLFTSSRHARSGGTQLFSEFVATFGLLSVIWGVARRRAETVPFAVGAYITAAYWFTASTSFANPAVTLARAASDTFAGIRPADVPGFVVAQLLGAGAATLLFRWLVPALPERAPEVVTPHEEGPEASEVYASALKDEPRATQTFRMRNDPMRKKLVGGWLRMLLGIIQMALATAAVIVWLSAGLQPVVWPLAGAALLFTLISFVLYTGRGTAGSGGNSNDAEKSSDSLHRQFSAQSDGRRDTASRRRKGLRGRERRRATIECPARSDSGDA